MMISIISAVGSVGAFAMALIYFVSIMIQVRQMKINFIPLLGFDQILVRVNKNNDELTISNMSESDMYNNIQTSFKIFNMGGGAAHDLTIDILLNNQKCLNTKEINVIPSKEKYCLPMNGEVMKELQKTFKNHTFDNRVYNKEFQRGNYKKV